jgi:hypothetical protein
MPEVVAATATPIVVDDHLLLRVLLGDEPPELRPDHGPTFITGLWYHRACRAVASPTVVGALSRRLGAADPAVGAAAVGAVIRLPEDIGLVSLRDLAWPMARLLDGGVRLNLLALEALAAAEHLGAELCLADVDDNPPLRSAAAARGVTTCLISG